MTQAAQTLDIHLSHARSLEGTLPGRGTEWIEELREQGLASYEEQGWPTTKQEAWKYTSLSAVRKTDFRPASEAPANVTEEQLAPFTFDETGGAQLVVVNGRFDEALSDLSALPDAVTVAPLSRVLEEDPERLRAHLGQHAEVDDNAFTALNTASFTDGAFVEIPEGTVVDVPVHVLYVTSTGEDPIVSHVRTLVVGGANSEASIVESYVGLGDGDALTNTVTEISCAANGVVRHAKLNRETEHTVHLSTQQVHQERDSVVRSHCLTFGGHLVRNNVYDLIDAEGCNAVLNGLYFGTGDQHIDNYTRIRHAAPHCDSHQLYKGVLDDESQGVFRGTIFVEKQAQRTDAYQHNPNLLLSRDALANSVPQLEIFADDVKCSHGSTTGQVDDEWIFYLRSRGLTEQESRNLLTYAFAGEVIEQIEIDAVRERVQDLVLERLPAADTVRSAL